jgi:hypothetical protein
MKKHVLLRRILIVDENGEARKISAGALKALVKETNGDIYGQTAKIEVSDNIILDFQLTGTSKQMFIQL